MMVMLPPLDARRLSVIPDGKYESALRSCSSIINLQLQTHIRAKLFIYKSLSTQADVIK